MTNTMLTREQVEKLADVIAGGDGDGGASLQDWLDTDAAMRAEVERLEREHATAYEEAARFCEWEGNDSDSITRERLVAVAYKLRTKHELSPALKDRIEDLTAQLTASEAQYYDLIMQVENKFPGESRHDTAKRYLNTHENVCGVGGPDKAQVQEFEARP